MGKITIIALICSLIASNSGHAEPEVSARFHLDKINEFIAEKASVFVMNKREVDPFGKHQDPNRKIDPRKIETPKNKPTEIKEQQVLIEQEIVKLSNKINVVGSRAIINSDSFKRGDKINVTVKGKTFPLKFLSIKQAKITFSDLTDGRILTLNMKTHRILPLHDPSDIPELNPGKNGIFEIEPDA